MKLKHLIVAGIAAAGLLVVAGCGPKEEATNAPTNMPAKTPKATGGPIKSGTTPASNPSELPPPKNFRPGGATNK